MSSEIVPEVAPIGLDQILETVHAQQSRIYGVLETLDSRSRELDTAVSDAVQRAFVDAAGVRAIEKFAQVQRTTGMRLALWSFGVVSACSILPTLMTWMLMPSRGQLLEARENLDALSERAAELARRGAQMDVRHCGEKSRLCVRIDRKSPFYGENADYVVIKGY